MNDPLPQVDLERAKGALTGIVDNILTEVTQLPASTAVLAMACALVAVCRGAGVDFDAVLDQVVDAEHYGDLPEGLLDYGVTADTVWH